MDIEDIRKKFKAGQVMIRDHALQRLDERGIKIEELEKVVMTGGIIEFYLNDKPYPSCLILGQVRNNKSLYVVCALADKAYVITAHWLDPEKWLDPKTRRDR